MNRRIRWTSEGVDAVAAVGAEGAVVGAAERGVRNEKHGLQLSDEHRQLLELDIGINAMGIAFAAARARKKSGAQES